MAKTVLEKRPVDQVPKGIAVPPGKEVRPLPRMRPPKLTRWIDFAAVVVVVAAAAAVVVLLLRSGDEAEELVLDVEAGSAPAIGARHEAGFTVGSRWVGASDMTLEEYEAAGTALLAPDEAASLLTAGDRQRDADLAVGSRWVGASDMTLEEYEAARAALGIPDEAASGPAVGTRHLDPDFGVGFRWVGASDMTLEEAES